MNNTQRSSQRRPKPELEPAVKSFCKIIFNSTINEKMMKIPSRFVRLGPKLNESVTIETPVGFKRCIGLKRLSNDDVWFDNGWSDFAKSHSLSLGHFLMFHYKGNSCFSVVIFDVSASEINYPIDQVYHIESDHDDDDYEGFSDNDLSEEVIDLDELLKKKKRPRTNIKPENITIIGNN
ncbi:unnamed protein product [Cochlearia groenlandica]